MKRLRLVFAIFLLILALPLWRYIDMVAILSPFAFTLPVALMLWFAIFITLPIKLINQKIKRLYIILAILCFGSLAWWTNPLSKMATTGPEFSHCGNMTYTGVIYPVRVILSDAHRDDLEARNQLCWIRKMISRLPGRFDSPLEVDQYTDLLEKKLLKPEIKFRSSLPLIAVLYFSIHTSTNHMPGMKKIYDSLHLWIKHYTEEINQREYSVWSRPHSDYIKFEYGLIEKNWQSLIDSIVLKN